MRLSHVGGSTAITDLRVEEHSPKRGHHALYFHELMKLKKETRENRREG